MKHGPMKTSPTADQGHIQGGEASGLCPRCGQPGKPVGRVTLEALLRPEVRNRLVDGSYRFCASEACDLVYFDSNGSAEFHKDELMVRVGIKESTAPRPICYCFDHTIEEVESDIQETGTTKVLQDIKDRMKEACWCQTKSPMGSCCLATVTRYVKAAEAKVGNQGANELSEDAVDCCSPAPQSGKAGLRLVGGRASRLDRMQWVTWGGGMLSAVVASACCWLPLVLIALGISGVAVSSAFEAYRPYFTVATLGILAAGFYLAYRPIAAGEGDPEEGGQRSDDCCSTELEPARRRFNRAMLWVASLIAMAFLFFPSYLGAFLDRNSESPAQSIVVGDSLVLMIDGMTCEACASLLQADLRKVPGVARAEVRYETQQAVVFADSSVTKNDLAEVVGRTGYSLADKH